MLADREIYENILKSAKKEFLEKGYEESSLRTICKNAGVTTGAFYNRFKGKDAIFDELVKPVLSGIQEFVIEDEIKSKKMLEKNKFEFEWTTAKYLKHLMNFLYDHFEDVRLLLCCAKGSLYSDFFLNFVDEHTNQKMNMLKIAKEKGIINKLIEQRELNILIMIFWQTVSQPILKEFSREEAISYCDIIAKFFEWNKVLGLNE